MLIIKILDQASRGEVAMVRCIVEGRLSCIAVPGGNGLGRNCRGAGMVNNELTVPELDGNCSFVGSRWWRLVYGWRSLQMPVLLEQMNRWGPGWRVNWGNSHKEKDG